MPVYEKQRLTDRQREVVSQLVRWMEKHNRPPTVREMVRLIGVSSVTGAVCHLNALVKHGVLVQDERSPYTLNPKLFKVKVETT